MSLDTFNRALDEFASKEARDARRHIHQNFPDYTQEDYSFEKWHNRLKTKDDTEEQKLWIREGMDEFKDEDCKPLVVRILTKESDDKKYFEEAAVRADRVGFMFFTLKDLSSEFKRKYIDWLCFTYCDMWNKIAPHVEQVRKERVKYVPYLEKLVYLAYLICNKAINDYNKKVKEEKKKKVKIIVLDTDTMTEIHQEYRELWDC